jgi:hypothetical protein
MSTIIIWVFYCCHSTKISLLSLFSFHRKCEIFSDFLKVLFISLLIACCVCLAWGHSYISHSSLFFDRVWFLRISKVVTCTIQSKLNFPCFNSSLLSHLLTYLLFFLYSHATKKWRKTTSENSKYFS